MRTWQLGVALICIPIVSGAQEAASVTDTPSASTAATAADTPEKPPSMPLPPFDKSRGPSRDDYYPSSAQRLGQQGRVLIEFSIAPTGQTTNLQVIASEPQGIFEKAGLRLVSWPRFIVPADWVSSGAAQHRFRFSVLFLLDYKPGTPRPIDPYPADDQITITAHKLVPPRG